MESASAEGDESAGLNQETEQDSPVSVSRRQFLAGVAGAAVTTAAVGTLPETTAGQTPQPIRRGATYGDAEISPEGHRLLAAHERFQQKKGNAIQFSKRVDAVKDLGCDPTGKEPIQDKVMNAVEDGALIVFPQGTYLATSDIIVDVEGIFGIVGEGFKNAKQPPKPGKNSVVFKIQTDHPFNFLKGVAGLTGGKFGNFVVDGRGSNSYAGVMMRSSGNVRVRDIRVLGAQQEHDRQDDNPAAFTPFAEGADSLIVYERCIARGGGIPGSKNIGGTHGFGVFGRDGERGTIILKDSVVENWADNGIYGARTGATVRVLGGMYRNNDVSQVRINGAAACDGVDIVIDEQNYTGLKSKSNADEQGPGWPATNGLKIETKKKIPGSWETGTSIKNCNIVGNSVAENGGVLGSLIHVWDSGGAVTVDNCRITNNIEATTSITAEEPGSGNWAAAPKPWTITVKNSVIEGKGAGGPAIKTSGRPRSIVKNTCFAYPGASKSDVSGPSVSGCGFGKQCKSAGLKNPQKVGSGGNLSSVPLNVSYNGSASASSAGGAGGGGLGWGGKLLGGLIAAPLIGIAVMVLPILLGLVVIGGVTFGSLLLYFKKLSN